MIKPYIYFFFRHKLRGTFKLIYFYLPYSAQFLCMYVILFLPLSHLRTFMTGSNQSPLGINPLTLKRTLACRRHVGCAWDIALDVSEDRNGNKYINMYINKYKYLSLLQLEYSESITILCTFHITWGAILITLSLITCDNIAISPVFRSIIRSNY